MDNDMINTNTYTSERPKAITEMGWGELKDHIFPCLTSSDGICQVKGDLVHDGFLDLNIHYYIRIESGDGKKIKILWIDQRLLAEWGIGQQTLAIQARNNLIKDRYTIRRVDDILKSLLDGSSIPGIQMDCPLYVLTNQRGFLGAAGILDKGIVAAFADSAGYDLFILPSSRHEVLLFPDIGNTTVEELDKMVKEVNSSEVDPCDRLSDHVYYYDRKMNEIRIRK